MVGSQSVSEGNRISNSSTAVAVGTKGQRVLNSESILSQLTAATTPLRYTRYAAYRDVTGDMANLDNGYKLLFSHQRMVRDLLTGFVKEE